VKLGAVDFARDAHHTRHRALARAACPDPLVVSSPRRVGLVTTGRT
jgi:hypothetical protein